MLVGVAAIGFIEAAACLARRWALGTRVVRFSGHW